MRSTIRDVAREAGVSIATVSRVMRDSSSVRPDTAERVRQVAHELEFVPSQLGRQLAERRHAANGIVFPDLSGPYYAEVVLGYEAVAAELGTSVLILSTHGRDDADRMVLEMAERCDGMVLLARTVGDVDRGAAGQARREARAGGAAGGGRGRQRECGQPRQRDCAGAAPGRAGCEEADVRR